MVLPQYNELSDFQKWFFFYIVKNTFAHTGLDGVLGKMCLTVKMNIDVDKFDLEQERLKKEANQLVNHGLLAVTTNHYPQSGEYTLTDKGELYVFQKILGPLIKINDKGVIEKLKQYISKEDSDMRYHVMDLINDMDTQKQRESLAKIANRVLDHAMPYLNAIDKIHKLAKIFGIQ